MPATPSAAYGHSDARKQRAFHYSDQALIHECPLAEKLAVKGAVSHMRVKLINGSAVTLASSSSSSSSSNADRFDCAFLTVEQADAARGHALDALSKQGVAAAEGVTLPRASSGEFDASSTSSLTLYTPSGSVLLLAGLGSDAKLTLQQLRIATWTLIEALRRLKATQATVYLPKLATLDAALIAATVARIAILSNNKFDKYLSVEPFHFVHDLTLVLPSEEEQRYDAISKQVQQAVIIAEATVFARELANDRGDCITPSFMEKIAKMIADSHHLKFTAVQDAELRQQGLHLLAGVGQGAKDGEKARLLVLEYRGNPSEEAAYALVGKSITFDTGGLNLKLTGHIESMALDMSGGAAMLGTVMALSSMGAKINVVCVLTVAENAIGPHAQKPNIILPSPKGSVEISNTDCEGRLAMVSGFTYVQRHYKIHTLINMATLTLGTAMMLGDTAAGIFSNSDALAEQITQAGSRTWERVWRLPVWEDHTEMLKNREGGADWRIYTAHSWMDQDSPKAAAFLQLFVEDGVRWCHVDAPGVAMCERQQHWIPKGATGFGVQLFTEFLLTQIASS